ncbi:effector-associated constant component EACC1 [Saccharothrix variisporea]|uniref:Uncharacterized protein n=1 Tax=Saccharothrix variisporea TaxID=543527 RepID=A0A495X5X6_9PSEU|nr:hypothetical protein [Saccharothrix variisporea]RKT69382.1 hypothetical protein DFJ66_2602 [Saccharothrix variisporea]
MEVRMHVICQDADTERESLLQWLCLEDELRGRVTVEQPEPVPGQMGGWSDVLVAALGGGGAVAVLAGAISTWLAHRRPDVEIEVTGPDGRSVRLSVNDARHTDAADAVRRALDTVGPGRALDEGQAG